MAIPHIYFKAYSKAKIFCPQIDEQIKISSNLSMIESKIKLEESFLFLFQEQKKFLLSQLFI